MFEAFALYFSFSSARDGFRRTSQALHISEACTAVGVPECGMAKGNARRVGINVYHC